MNLIQNLVLGNIKEWFEIWIVSVFGSCWSIFVCLKLQLATENFTVHMHPQACCRRKRALELKSHKFPTDTRFAQSKLASSKWLCLDCKWTFELQFSQLVLWTYYFETFRKCTAFEHFDIVNKVAFKLTALQHRS